MLLNNAMVARPPNALLLLLLLLLLLEELGVNALATTIVLSKSLLFPNIPP